MPEGTEQVVNVNVIVSAVDSQLANESTGASREFYLPRQIASSRRCTVSRAELDSHADTCVVGKHCLVIRDWDQLLMFTVGILRMVKESVKL